MRMVPTRLLGFAAVLLRFFFKAKLFPDAWADPKSRVTLRS